MAPNDPTPDASSSAPEPPTVRVTSDLPGSVTLAVTGDLDDAGTAVLGDALHTASDAGHRQVTVDLCAVAFVGDSAVRVLLETYAHSRARGRALRIIVATGPPLRLLAGVGLERVTQLRTAPGDRRPAPDVASPSDPMPPGGPLVRRHLRLVGAVPAAEPDGAAADTGLVLLRRAAVWSRCEDVPTVAGALADEALRFLPAVERAELGVLDGPHAPGWWAAAERGRPPRAGVGASRSAAVAALTTGARGSLLTLRLGGADASAVGSLIVSSTALDAFDERTWREAHLFAAVAADVVSGTRHRHHRALAIAHEDTIGQAQGMLMERYGLTADRALAALTRASSTRNTGLREVAESLIRTGEL